MIIKKMELENLLNKLKPGLAKKDLVEQMSHFIFDGDMVRTYNDHLCIQAPFKTGFKCSVKANDLSKLVSKIKANDLILKVKDGEFLVTSRGGVQKAGFDLIEDDSEVRELIDSLGKTIKDSKWKKIPEGFIEGVSLCMFSCSRNESDGTQTCLYIKKDTILASDKFRVSKYVMKGRMKKLYLKASSAAELINLPDIEKYAIADGWVCFSTKEGIIFSCRTYEGNFLDIEGVFDKEHKGIEVKLPDNLKEALETVSIVTDDDDVLKKYVDLIFSKNRLVCKRKKKHKGWITHRLVIDLDIEGEITITINPTFLEQIINKVNKVIINDNQAYFLAEDFEHILLTATKQEEE